MMKKGFTLVELLAVITILGLLGLIVGLSITSSIRGVRKETSETQKNNILTAAKNWAADNIYILPDVGDSMVVSLHDLIAEGFMEADKDNQISDVENGKMLSKLRTTVTITNNNGDYEYTLDIKYGEDDVNIKAPVIVLNGSSNMTVNGTFNDPGVYAYDSEGNELGSITTRIEDQNGAVITAITTKGTYTITYTVTDVNGSSWIKRTVVVK